MRRGLSLEALKRTQEVVQPAAHIAGEVQLRTPVQRIARLDASGEVGPKVQARVDTEVS